MRVGVEHELRLWTRDRQQADFRRLIGEVAGHIRALDPGDPRARRLPSGVALTADGREAELATPPVPLGREAPARLDDLLRGERTELRDAVAPHGVVAVSGFSTHLNLSVPDDEAVRLGEMVVRHCLRAVAAVLEPRTSSGMLVRPRRHRLELGGEYAEGDDLRASITLLVACVAGLRAGASPAEDPPATTEASREKFGWFVPPSGLGSHRSLVRTWAWAREHANALDLDTSPVDRLVSGEVPLRSARDDDPAACSFGGEVAGPAYPTGERVLPGGLVAETQWLTWEHAVWRLRDERGRECRAVVPLDDEAAFLAALDRGEHADAIARQLRPWSRRRTLLVNAQVRDAVFWSDVRPGALVPAERGPDGSVPRVSIRAARRAHRRR